MKKTIFLRVTMLALLLFLSICLTVSLLHIIFPRHSTAPKLIVTSPIPKVETPSVVTYAPPVRLEITKLSVAAPVVAVGLAQDNTMDIGKDIAETAWYKLGPKPGEAGSAVIAGHYGWINGQGAVFNDLHTIQPGDKISVFDEKGRTINFIVREARRYNLDADTTEVFRPAADKKSHLNLITCDGSWNRSRQTYSDRLVVFSDLET